MASHMNEYNAFNLPPELEPISAWGYVGYSILYAIPVIGWIFLIVFCISDKNINRRSFSRGYLLMALILILVCVALTITGTGSQVVSSIQDGSLQSQAVETVQGVIGA